MVLEETRRILNILKGEYPQSFKTMTKNEMDLKLNIWQKILSPYPNNIVENAVLDIIANSKRDFAPQVSEIKAVIKRQLLPDSEIIAEQEWQRVREFMQTMSGDREIDSKKYYALHDVTRQIYPYSLLREMRWRSTVSIDCREKWFVERFADINERRTDALLQEGKLEELVGTPQWQMLGTGNLQKEIKE